MRLDTAPFAAKNVELAKRPRYVIELAFDPANTVLWYFTSHSDSALPGGASSILGVIQGMSGTSQTLNPDTANASIGNINFELVDKGSIVTTTLGSQLVLGRSTRRQRVRVYVGYEGLAWADYTLVQTQLLNEIAYSDGAYKFTCADVQREMRKDIFELAKTTLAQSLSIDATVVEVFSTAAFQTVAHGTSYSDAPSATVGYVKIQDEVIRYTSKTGTQFILGAGGMRGALNTRAVEHAIDAATSADRRTAVEEYVYLELPAVKLSYALLRGDIPGFSLLFNGGTTMQVNVPHAASLNFGTGDITIEAWFKTTDTTTDKRAFINKSWTGGAPGGFGFGLAPGGEPYYLWTDSAGHYNEGVTHNTSVANGAAHHVCNVYRRAVSVTGFVDGVKGNVVPRTDLTLSSDNATAVQIGNASFSAASVVTADGVRIYNRALSDAEVAQHAQGIFTNETGLVAKWNFDEGTGTTTADGSGNGNTGTLLNVPTWAPLLAIGGGAKLPTAWNLSIPSSYVRLADFTGIGTDLWNTADDSAGFNVRLEGLAKTDGKKFIEAELALLAGVFMPVYADGALGLKRMSNMLAGASYVKLLDNSNIVSIGDLVHDFNALHNVLQISWNWEPSQKDFTRVNLLVDASSVATHGRSDPLKLKFRGLHGSIHSSTILAQRFDSIRDRYTGPPQRVDVNVVPSLNTLEVGDVVRLRPAGVRDFVVSGGGALDRSFEVQKIALDWVTGNLKLSLFASSQAPGAIAATSDATVLTDAWYSSQGTLLSSVLTITGSNPGHVTVNGTLTGAADMNAAGSIFYYPGDLVIDAGVTVNVVNNVQLRVKGFLQNNGVVNGVGNGIAGGGVAGFIGSTEAGGGFTAAQARAPGPIFRVTSFRGDQRTGTNSSMPSFNLEWDGTTLSGLPGDLRGSPGLAGGTATYHPVTGADTVRAGGAGGASGAGLEIISRGLGQGVVAKIDLSGAAGSAGATASVATPAQIIHAGSGGGGAPGGLFVLLDGAGTSATGLTETGFIAKQGSTPVTGVPFNPATYFVADFTAKANVYSSFVGTGDGTTFPLAAISGARGGSRVQYVPGNVAAAADLSSITLAAPTNLSLASGTAELLVQGDGTIVPRIRVTWTPSLDSRTVGYDLQFKPSSETLWSSAPLIFGQSSSAAFIANIADGINYDIRLRAAGAAREISEWVTITGYAVIGKTERPSDVADFSIEGTRLSWTLVSDVDVTSGGGYRIKYQPGTSQSWGDALALHSGLLTSSPFDMLIVPSGAVTIMIKAVDSSGNESQSVASIGVNLGELFIANVVETFDRKAAGFPGTKTACTVSVGNLVSDAITPLAWKSNDQADAWNLDPATLAWAVTQYATMTYVDTIIVTRALAGSRLTIQKTIAGDPWSLEYRENSAALAWRADSSALAWNADSATLAWDSPAWLPWPGEISVKNSIYDIRIMAGQANTQGIVSQLTLTVDAPDISEFIANVAISAGGTRLPITKSYISIKGVNLTLVADGGTAIRPQQEDALATGPLVKTYDAAAAAVSGHVNARIEGY